jgi:hypothetical protein
MDHSSLSLSEGPHRVCQVAVPPAARALSTLARIDYADAFLVQTGPAENRTAEQWARAILEQAPITTRAQLLSGWSAIGLKVGTLRAERSVLGWQVRVSAAEFALLGADSRIGMPGQLLFKRERRALLFCTFVQHNNPVARAVWAAVEPAHIRVVRDLLEEASQRLCSESSNYPAQGFKRK